MRTFICSEDCLNLWVAPSQTKPDHPAGELLPSSRYGDICLFPSFDLLILRLIGVYFFSIDLVSTKPTEQSGMLLYRSYHSLSNGSDDINCVRISIA